MANKFKNLKFYFKNKINQNLKINYNNNNYKKVTIILSLSKVTCMSNQKIVKNKIKSYNNLKVKVLIQIQLYLMIKDKILAV